jgi:hypothetical protein
MYYGVGGTGISSASESGSMGPTTVLLAGSEYNRELKYSDSDADS